MTGSGFQSTSHWKILTQDDNKLAQDKLSDTDGFQLYPIIAYRAERKYNPTIVATKFNHKEECTKHGNLDV